ncbi:MAG: cryptochrome/photolyase family protein [Bdellovibrionales bacterium]
MSKSKTRLFWFRRDLRLYDNEGLAYALSHFERVVPVFIFDTEILSRLGDKKDLRVQFIHQTLLEMKKELAQHGSDLRIEVGRPVEVFQKLHQELDFAGVLCNHDYEPYPRQRDEAVRKWAQSAGVEFQSFKDQVIFEQSEILTDAKKPYTVYTPYKKKWLSQFKSDDARERRVKGLESHFARLTQSKAPTLSDVGFQESDFPYPGKRIAKPILSTYARTRDFPYLADGTTHLGLHLRFGTISVRESVRAALEAKSDVWLSELIWREFFMQILWHFPQVVKQSFRPEYDQVEWRKSSEDFERWCEGQTGYPLVDAGMRELNATGYMHNRVRMVTASFLCKHLLIHWSKGERYFAAKLLDYDLASNNGNWQWAAGTGCDAAPYFRIFNPQSQQEKFDPDLTYVRKWVPEYGTSRYAEPMVDHAFARERCLAAFKKALKK